jgi:voltage-gated potassium channel
MAAGSFAGSAASLRQGVRLPVLPDAPGRRSDRWRNVRRVVRKNVIERKMARFLREPPTVRGAVSTIVTATATVVVLGGVLIRVFDHDEYGNVWVGMWWAMQTVTTVGYGDVTPVDVSGRIIAAVVMLQGIAFLAIITAAITSTFVARATKEHAAEQTQDEISELQKIEARFDDLDERLDRLDAALRELRS